MSCKIDIGGIKYTLALSIALKGFQVALCVLNAQGYIDHHYTSVVKTFENYWDAKSYYAGIYRYQTGKQLED